MKNEKNEFEFTCDFAVRWRPDWRYTNNKFISIPLNNFKSNSRK